MGHGLEIEELMERAWQEHCSASQIDNAAREVIHFVHRHRADVTMMHIENLLFDLGLPVNGKFALLLNESTSICVWANASWQFCAVLRTVMKSGQVQYALAPVAAYRPVLRILNLPVVDSPRECGTLSLLPVYLRPVSGLEDMYIC